MGQMEQLADQPAGQRGSSGVERCLPEGLDKTVAFASPLQSGAVRTVGHDTVSVQVMSQLPPHPVSLAGIRCGVSLSAGLKPYGGRALNAASEARISM